MLLLTAFFLSGCNMSLDSGTTKKGSLYPEYPYITEVFDYCYGAGQHSEAHGSIMAKPSDKEKFIGTESDYVLLGGWGGYITAGFDHDVLNFEGYDFAVYTQPGTGNEPAVVYVMDDADGNGKPDGTWYELSGSDTGADYSSGGTYYYEGGAYDDPAEVTLPPDPLNKYIRDYELTYCKADLTLDKNDPAYGNVTWKDNQGNSGILKSMFWTETSELWWWPYYGEGVTSKTFRGVKLPNNKFTPDGKYWWDFEDRLNWGYAENYAELGAVDCKTVTFGSKTRSANCFDISNAIGGDGKPVKLEKIRFIKVQTGVFLQAGWLNEVSSEVSGAVDLHCTGISVE